MQTSTTFILVQACIEVNSLMKSVSFQPVSRKRQHMNLCEREPEAMGPGQANVGEPSHGHRLNSHDVSHADQKDTHSHTHTLFTEKDLTQTPPISLMPPQWRHHYLKTQTSTRTRNFYTCTHTHTVHWGKIISVSLLACG